MRNSLLDDPLLRDVPVVDGYKFLDPAVLVSKIAKGGMAAVYRGVHLHLATEVAVKILLRDGPGAKPEIMERFRLEAQRAAQLKESPHIVQVQDFKVRRDGMLYLVMEFVDGETADGRVLRRKAALGGPEAATIIEQALRGLLAAHNLNLIHRDIKPGNILISRKGHVKVTDFGIARVNTPGDMGMTSEFTLLGTPLYMAPELWNGAVFATPASDVYAIGVTLGNLLAGRNLIDGADEAAVKKQHVIVGYPKLKDVLPSAPTALASLISQATAINPEDRPSVIEMIESLGKYLAQAGGAFKLDDPVAIAGMAPQAMPTRPDLGLIRVEVEKPQPEVVPPKEPQSEKPKIARAGEEILDDTIRQDQQKPRFQSSPQPEPSSPRTPAEPVVPQPAQLDPASVPVLKPDPIRPGPRWGIRVVALVLLMGIGTGVWGVSKYFWPDTPPGYIAAKAQIELAAEKKSWEEMLRALPILFSRARDEGQSAAAETVADAALSRLLAEPDITLRGLDLQGQLWPIAKAGSVPADKLLLRILTESDLNGTDRRVPADRARVDAILNAADLLGKGRGHSDADGRMAARWTLEASTVSAELDRDAERWPEMMVSVKTAGSSLQTVEEAIRPAFRSRLSAILMTLRVKLPDLNQRREILPALVSQLQPLMDQRLSAAFLLAAEAKLRKSPAGIEGLQTADDLAAATEWMNSADHFASGKADDNVVTEVQKLRGRLASGKGSGSSLVNSNGGGSSTPPATQETSKIQPEKPFFPKTPEIKPALKPEEVAKAYKDLELALRTGSSEEAANTAIDLIVANVPLKAGADRCRSILAVEHGREKVVSHLIAIKEPLSSVKNGDSLLHLAAMNGSTAIIKALIENGGEAGLSPMSRNSLRETPLHTAAIYQKTEPQLFELLATPESLMARDNGGHTPLHLAAARSSSLTVSLILEQMKKHHCEINTPDGQGHTALDLAEDKAIRETINQAGGRALRPKD